MAISLLLLLTALARAVIAQGTSQYTGHTQDTRICVAGSPITAFSGCQSWDSFVTSCGSYATASDAQGYFNCYCQQKYLNALYDCNNEERLCIPQSASVIDLDFTPLYSSWHKWCDPIVLYTPTTPILSSITASYDGNYCNTALSACTKMTQSRNQCYATWNTNDGTTMYSSCVCAPPVLSLEYTCSFLGNVSCLQVPAHLDHMSGWTYCPGNINQVLTVPGSVTSSLGTGTTNRATYYTPSATTTATPAGTLPQTRSAPATSTATNLASRPSPWWPVNRLGQGWWSSNVLYWLSAALLLTLATGM